MWRIKLSARRRGSSNHMERQLQFTGIMSNRPEEDPGIVLKRGRPAQAGKGRRRRRESRGKGRRHLYRARNPIFRSAPTRTPDFQHGDEEAAGQRRRHE
ncbi:pectin acetylesterase 12-like [Panicum miliaceum]|uniref:Pectin acetylesterase 12-like n=1 Tax=Panicum miliaceum TaxID=4540 RepID=A0A3L6RE45_PANMI|nr:pectin acetylesterase 12-like [Panicum miliaceum]